MAAEQRSSDFEARRGSYIGARIGEGAHVLVTGGQGYIGSHTTLLMLQEGFTVTVIDNSVNSTAESLKRVKELVEPEEAAKLHFRDVDLMDAAGLEQVLSEVPPVNACIHFGGLKAVGESTREPIRYYQNNVAGTLNLLQALENHGCRQIVFSSSATVYGSAPVPITETSPTGGGITNPYGRSKYMIEEILMDLHKSPGGKDWGIVTLRYFNPVGAHPSGRIGEDPSGPPNNLMPYVSQVAVGRRASLTVFGSDCKSHPPSSSFTEPLFVFIHSHVPTRLDGLTQPAELPNM